MLQANPPSQSCTIKIMFFRLAQVIGSVISIFEVCCWSTSSVFLHALRRIFARDCYKNYLFCPIVLQVLCSHFFTFLIGLIVCVATAKSRWPWSSTCCCCGSLAGTRAHLCHWFCAKHTREAWWYSPVTHVFLKGGNHSLRLRPGHVWAHGLLSMQKVSNLRWKRSQSWTHEWHHSDHSKLSIPSKN